MVIMKKINPTNWKFLEFGNFVSRSDKRFNPKKEKKNYKCIELKHIEEETGRLIGYTYSQKQKSIKNKFKKEEILYGKLRPYLKKFWIACFDGVCSSEIWVLNSINDKCSNKYLFYLIQTNLFNQIANISSGTKMPRADWRLIAEYPFSIPPKKEQDKIVQILSTWDHAIITLEKLINAKKQYKKALMQQLLTGKKRFPEFEGEPWIEVKLKDILSTIESGKRPKGGVSKINIGISSFGGENIKNDGYVLYDVVKKVPVKFFETMKSGILCDKDIIINKDGAQTGKIGFYRSKHQKACINEHLFLLRANKGKIDQGYLFYLLSSNIGQGQIKCVISGSAQPGINSNFIKILRFKIPKSLNEQIQIRKLFSNIDSEINLLRKKVKHLKIEKKGLMQQLLTGKKRVV